MSILKTKQVGIIHQQTSNSTNSGSPFSGDINNFSTQLTYLLSEEKQTELQEKNEKIKVLLEQLEDTVKTRSDEIDYDYKKDDYEVRLCQDHKVTKKTLNEKILVGDIKVIYDKLVPLLRDGIKLKNNILEKKLFRETLENLVYESMESSFLEKIEFKKIILSGIESAETLENTFKSIVDDITIDLSSNNLGNLGKNSLDIIFKYLSNVKSINLQRNDLGNLDKSYLETTFKHFINVKIINLANNDLGDLNKESLDTIFKHLINVKSINLWFNNLGNLGKESLEVIFKHLNNVKCVELYSNELGKLDKDCLDTIFKHLISVINIDLRNNNLGNLDKESLDTIFKYINNAKYISLYDNDFSDEQEMYIKSLIPNTIINFYH